MRVPFVGSAAVASGELTPFALRRWHRPIYRGIYVPVGHQVSLRDRVVGLGLAAPDAVIAGIAASALTARSGSEPMSRSRPSCVGGGPRRA